MTFLLAFVVLFFSGCSVIPVSPQQKSQPAQTDSIIEQGIEDFLPVFSVELSPYGTKTQVAVTNISPDMYNWVVLYVAFVNSGGETVKVAELGAYSQMGPNDTVYYYTDAGDATDAYVYAARNNYFTFT
jgi:hypothetical protein